jgi:two-component system, OmpR family, sensor kinase
VTVAEESEAPGATATIAALRHEVAELRAAVQARNDFISIAAHELRNPMTPLLIIVQSMRRMADRHPETPEQIAAGLIRLDRVVLRYIQRCSALLDISRLSSDTFRIELAEFDLAALVRAAVEEMKPFAERARSTITVMAPAALMGEWDELAIQQIVENLLSNAIKYGAGKPIAVQLSIGHGTTLLEVRDQGIGIGQADQARIFAPFERAVTRRQQPGFGLGLWVVGRLVAALNGTVQVTSSPGQGSTFRVRLPQYQTTRVG